MQGSIAFDGTLSGSIAGGGGGGSEVTITPTLTEGEKIADFEIDGTQGELYAPESGSIVSITPSYIDGEKIADFSIDGVAGKIYQPKIFYIHKIEKEYNENPGDTLLFYYTESDGDRAAIYCPAAQAPLTAGVNITIDADNVISASGGSSWNYSTTEVNTGQKWIDGKDIYCRVISENSSNPVLYSSWGVNNIISLEGYFTENVTVNNSKYSFNLYVNNTYNAFIENNTDAKTITLMVNGWTTLERYAIVKYTKS